MLCSTTTAQRTDIRTDCPVSEKTHTLTCTHIHTLACTHDTCLARAKAADEKFVKLREVYQKLRGEHITLLRTNGENQKKLLAVEKAKMDAEGEAKVGFGDN